MNKLKKIEYLVGSKISENISLEPYNEKILDFLSDLSKVLNLNKSSKYFPDVITLAFYCRKQNLLNLKNKFLVKSKRLGLGLLFHITPSNIPTNFAYSLLFGLLTGNSNTVKVPTKKFDQIDIICKSIKKVLNVKKYSSLKNMISIIRYNSEDNEEITRKISEECDARIIWGGDKTINQIRKIPIKARTVDIPFPDRYSLCVINSNEIFKLDKIKLNSLVNKFFNDTYIVDQNACSSPQLIYWTGNKNKEAKNIFWRSLQDIVKKKYAPPSLAAIDNYTNLCSYLINLKNLKYYNIYDKSIYVIGLKKINLETNSLRGKWGFFFEYESNNFNNILNLVDKKCQTLTYFGFKKKFFEEFIDIQKPKGIDRIVPIGQALDINLNWDGYDINTLLSREIIIK